MNALRLILPALLLLSGLDPAAAHDHRPPKAILKGKDALQQGLALQEHWLSRYDADECEAGGGDSVVISFPQQVRLAAPQAPSIRLRKRAMPVEVAVRQWPEVDDEGHAQGEGVSLPWALSPVKRDGATVAWDVTVPVTVPRRHLYLGLEAYWQDEEGCAGTPDLGSQSMFWTFHAKT